MGIILFLVSTIMLYILSIPMVLFSLIFDLKHADKYFYNLAFAIDQLGNVLCSTVFNSILLKKDPKKLYGNPDETISHVTGVNFLAGKLTWLGMAIAKILNFLDKDHVQKAAGNNQDNK